MKNLYRAYQLACQVTVVTLAIAFSWLKFGEPDLESNWWLVISGLAAHAVVFGVTVLAKRRGLF